MIEYRNTFLHGDCLDILPSIPSRSVGLVLTDPPYIAHYQDRTGRRVANDDNDRWLKPAFIQLHRVLANDSFAVSFYGWPKAAQFQDAFRSAGFRIVGHFVFPKRYTSSTHFTRYQHECAHLLAKGNPRAPADPIGDVIDWVYSGNKFHPTQKPVSVLMPLIETFSQRGDLVLDPFAGSGSSLIAAHALGRNFLGIEKDPKWYPLAKVRVDAFLTAPGHHFEATRPVFSTSSSEQQAWPRRVRRSAQPN